MQRSFSLTWLWVLLLVLLIAVPQPSAAQFLHLENILESDGLPSPDIKSITQDHRGVVWVATRGGIAFNNGLTWEKANLDSLTSSTAEGLLEIDQDGDVWALLSGNEPALLRHKFGNWEPMTLPEGFANQHHEFTHLVLASDGERTVALIAELPNQLHVSTNDGWLQVPLGQNGIQTITDLTLMNGNFILASSQGVFSIPASAPSSVLPLLNSQPPNIVRSLCLSRLDNHLWMVGNNWIGKVVQGEIEFVAPPQSDYSIFFSGHFPRICQTDAYGGIYLSSVFSTQYFHPETGMETKGPNNGFMEFGTTDFFLDRENVLWQGTFQGIHKVLSRYTTSYNRQQGLFSDEVTALLRRSDGTLLVGHNNGLTLWNGQMTHHGFQEKDFRDRVLDMAEDSQGNVWIAGRQRGVGRLSLDGSLRWWPLKERINNFTSSVLVDDRDRIWIAASDKLLIMDNGELSEYPLLSHMEKGVYLRRLIKGRDGTVYVATGNRGLLAIKGEDFRQWRTGLRDHGDSVYDVLENSDGMILVGTRNGLYQLEGDRLVRPPGSHLKVNRPVYFLEIDHKDRLWLGTNNGVIRVDEDQVTHLTAEDGLIGRETNRCANFLDPDGRFWVGTERGLTVFNDLFENSDPLPPLVYLVELEVAGKTYPLVPGSRDITLPAQSANLVFHYQVLTTRGSKRLDILSQLDGVDNDWVQHKSPGQQIIRYTNVSPGSYQFHLKAAGFRQTWSDVANSPAIIIPAPIWQRPWFMVGAGLALLAMLTLPIIFVAQRRYTIRLKKEVEEQVAANLRIEAELEQGRNLKALGLLAGGIAHDFNNLLTIIFGNLSLLRNDDSLDSLQIKHLSTATGAIERARGLTNQLLTFSRGGAPILEVGSLAELVRENADFVLRGSNTKCCFELPDDLWPVVMDSGQMSQVVNNLLMNAREAMPSGGVVVLKGRNLDLAPTGLSAGIYVEITLTDNGPGIEPENLSNIFDPYFSTKEKGSGLGLATAYSILDRHAGRLAVESTPGQGTTFQLLIPASSDAPNIKHHHEMEPDAPLEGTVLVLDDDPDVRKSLGLMLQSLGFKIENADEGSFALDLYRKMLNQGHPPEIVLMDLTIPGGLGGQDIIAPLLEMDPKAKAIVISGYSHDPVISQYQDHGFKAAIAKPIMVHELGKILRKVLAE